MKHVSILAVGVVFTWFMILTIGFWGKAYQNGFANYFSYLTNWAWTFSWVFFTIEVAGYLQQWAGKSDWILRKNAYFLFWIVWGVAWSVFWLVFLLFAENPDIILGMADQGYDMGLVLDMDRMYHVMPAVVLLAYLAIRWKFFLQAFGEEWYYNQLRSLSSTVYQRNRDLDIRKEGTTDLQSPKGMQTWEDILNKATTSSPGDVPVFTSLPADLSLELTKDMNGQFAQDEGAAAQRNFDASETPYNLRPYSSNIEHPNGSPPTPHFDNDMQFFTPTYLQEYTHFSPSPHAEDNNRAPMGVPHNGIYPTATETRNKTHSNHNHHHHRQHSPHQHNSVPYEQNPDLSYDGVSLPFAVSMADSMDPRGDSVNIILSLLGYIGGPFVFLLAYAANYDFREVYNLGDTPTATVALLVLLIIFVITGISLIMLYQEVRLNIERRNAFAIIGGLLVNGLNINPAYNFPSIYEIYAREDPYVVPAADLNPARTFLDGKALETGSGTFGEELEAQVRSEQQGMRRRAGPKAITETSSGDMHRQRGSAIVKTVDKKVIAQRAEEAALEFKRNQLRTGIQKTGTLKKKTVK